MSTRSVFCLTSSREQAERVVRDLHSAGVAAGEISLLGLDTRTTDNTGDWIAGITPISISGIAPLLVAAGPVAAALHRTTVDSVAGGLSGFGLPTTEAARYTDRILAGDILISVHATNSDTSDRSREIFTAAHAGDIFTIVQVTTPRVSLLRAHRSVGRPAA
jgi:hypothetical protein